MASCICLLLLFLGWKEFQNDWHYSAHPIISFLLLLHTFQLVFSCRKVFRFRNGGRDRLIIYGAGTSGRQLANALTNNNEMSVVGFTDDDVRLHGQVLNGLEEGIQLI